MQYNCLLVAHSTCNYIIHLETECLKCASPCISDLPTELLVGQHEAFQPNGELHITASHHVLDLEV